MWLVGLAMTLVWKMWEGRDLVAQPALLEPSDGGERSSFLSVKPREKARAKAMQNLERKLHTKLPAEISLTTRMKPLAAFDPVSTPYLPGGGWNGGVGKSFRMGEGGNGAWGCGASGVFLGSRKPEGSIHQRTQSVPPRLAIVLDTSGSMRAQGGTENPPALREFINVVTALPAEGFFSVVCFCDEAALFREESVPATPENTAAAVAWARERFRRPHSGNALPVPAGTAGTSRLDLGISAALAGRPAEVLLISDGCPVVREGGRSLPHGAILARISASVPDNMAAPVLHTIATGTHGSGFLSRLAAEFDGHYRSAASD